MSRDEADDADEANDAGEGDDLAGGPTPSEQARAAREDAEWTPPRELVLLLAALVATGSAALVFVGKANGWTAPTLGVIFATGLVEAAIAVGLAVKIALAGHRKKGLFVSGITVTVLGTFSLVGILLLSGVL